MSRFTRRAAVVVTAAAVALAPMSAAHGQDLKDLQDGIKAANQGLQVAQQGTNLLNQFSSLSSGSSNSGTQKPAPTPGGGGNPSTPAGGEFLNWKTDTATLGGKQYQFSTVSSSDTYPKYWNLDKPYTRMTATLGFDDKHQVTGYKAKVVVRADDTILGEYLVEAGKPRHIDLKLNKPSRVSVDWTVTNHADEPGRNSRFVIGSPKVYL